ncbi:MAG: SPASM domain-containing protein [Candidatus Xenobia bacterium]
MLSFLELLREEGVYSIVMLTLTRDNIDQVLSLGEKLRGLANLFSFNRICPTGRGALLKHLTREQYKRLLEAYVEASKRNPVLGYKDNLLNLVLEREDHRFGGCTGHGCGAAFDFVAILPDGAVHACRKFDSPIGNLNQQTLGEIYDGSEAGRYRRGIPACDGCRLRAVCGGCMGVTPTARETADPACFIQSGELNQTQRTRPRLNPEEGSHLYDSRLKVR